MNMAKLILDGHEHEFPVVVGSEGERGIDISSLRSGTAAVTLDPGYGNTGSCVSEITFIDGERGILRYRGYPIEQVAEQADFVEVGYLLIYGKLPNRRELDELQAAAHLPQPAPRGHEEVLRGLPADRPPDGDPVVDGGVAVGLLPVVGRPSRTSTSTSCG